MLAKLGLNRGSGTTGSCLLMSITNVATVPSKFLINNASPFGLKRIATSPRYPSPKPRIKPDEPFRALEAHD